MSDTMLELLNRLEYFFKMSISLWPSKTMITSSECHFRLNVIAIICATQTLRVYIKCHS